MIAADRVCADPCLVQTLQLACQEEDGGKRVKLGAWVNGSRVFSTTDADNPNPNWAAGVTVTRISKSDQTFTATYDDFEISKIKE